jgi:uncharacterized protein (TIGR00156 family)
MMKPKEILLVFIPLLLLTSLSEAQFTGPGTAAPITVKGVLDRPVDDQWVTLKGRITKHLGSDKYIFTDGTGRIQLDIDDKYFPSEAPITPETVVQISGEVDAEFLRSPEIDVKQIIILHASDKAGMPKPGFQAK